MQKDKINLDDFVESIRFYGIITGILSIISLYLQVRLQGDLSFPGRFFALSKFAWIRHIINSPWRFVWYALVQQFAMGPVFSISQWGATAISRVSHLFGVAVLCVGLAFFFGAWLGIFWFYSGFLWNRSAITQFSLAVVSIVSYLLVSLFVIDEVSYYSISLVILSFSTQPMTIMAGFIIYQDTWAQTDFGIPKDISQLLRDNWSYLCNQGYKLKTKPDQRSESQNVVVPLDTLEDMQKQEEQDLNKANYKNYSNHNHVNSHAKNMTLPRNSVYFKAGVYFILWCASVAILVAYVFLVDSAHFEDSTTAAVYTAGGVFIVDILIVLSCFSHKVNSTLAASFLFTVSRIGFLVCGHDYYFIGQSVVFIIISCLFAIAVANRYTFSVDDSNIYAQQLSSVNLAEFEKGCELVRKDRLRAIFAEKNKNKDSTPVDATQAAVDAESKRKLEYAIQSIGFSELGFFHKLGYVLTSHFDIVAWLFVLLAFCICTYVAWDRRDVPDITLQYPQPQHRIMLSAIGLSICLMGSAIIKIAYDTRRFAWSTFAVAAVWIAMCAGVGIALHRETSSVILLQCFCTVPMTMLTAYCMYVYGQDAGLLPMAPIFGTASRNQWQDFVDTVVMWKVFILTFLIYITVPVLGAVLSVQYTDTRWHAWLPFFAMVSIPMVIISILWTVSFKDVRLPLVLTWILALVPPVLGTVGFYYDDDNTVENAYWPLIVLAAGVLLAFCLGAFATWRDNMYDIDIPTIFCMSGVVVLLIASAIVLVLFVNPWVIGACLLGAFGLILLLAVFFALCWPFLKRTYGSAQPIYIFSVVAIPVVGFSIYIGVKYHGFLGFSIGWLMVFLLVLVLITSQHASMDFFTGGKQNISTVFPYNILPVITVDTQVTPPKLTYSSQFVVLPFLACILVFLWGVIATFFLPRVSIGLAIACLPVLVFYCFVISWSLNTRYYLSQAIYSLGRHKYEGMGAIITEIEARALTNQINLQATPSYNTTSEHGIAYPWNDLPLLLSVAKQKHEANHNYIIGQGIGNRLLNLQGIHDPIIFSVTITNVDDIARYNRNDVRELIHVIDRLLEHTIADWKGAYVLYDVTYSRADLYLLQHYLHTQNDALRMLQFAVAAEITVNIMKAAEHVEYERCRVLQTLLRQANPAFQEMQGMSIPSIEQTYPIVKLRLRLMNHMVSEQEHVLLTQKIAEEEKQVQVERTKQTEHDQFQSDLAYQFGQLASTRDWTLPESQRQYQWRMENIRVSVKNAPSTKISVSLMKELTALEQDYEQLLTLHWTLAEQQVRNYKCTKAVAHEEVTYQDLTACLTCSVIVCKYCALQHASHQMTGVYKTIGRCDSIFVPSVEEAYIPSAPAMRPSTENGADDNTAGKMRHDDENEVTIPMRVDLHATQRDKFLIEGATFLDLETDEQLEKALGSMLPPDQPMPQCKKSVYIDKEFPPNDTSLGPEVLAQVKPHNPKWKRQHEIGAKAVFAAPVDASDMKQGSLGDCWFLASLSVVAQRCPQRLLQLFLTKHLNKEGMYTVSFYVGGDRVAVTIDDHILCNYVDSQWVPMFAKSGQAGEVYIPLLEKAFAKLYGGYSKLISGFPENAFTCLTGGVTEGVRIEGEIRSQFLSGAYYTQLETWLNAGSIICLSSNTGVDTKIVRGIAQGHCYALLGVAQARHPRTGNKVYLARLSNPWAHTEWTGDWGDSSSLWTAALRKQLHFLAKDDGQFYMALSDLADNFARLSVCYPPMPSTIAHTTVLTGEWRPGMAGGCENEATYYRNPQFLLHTPERTNCRVSILRADCRLLCEEETASGIKILANKGRAIDTNTPSAIVLASTAYTYRGSTLTTELPSHKENEPYTIILATYEAQKSGKFWQQVTSDKPVTLYSIPQGYGLGESVRVYSGKLDSSIGGGCANYPKTVHNNPYWHITVQKPTTVRVVLERKKTNDPNKPGLGMLMGLFDQNKPAVKYAQLMAKTGYKASDILDMECTLTPKDTSMMPLTLFLSSFNPNEFAEWTVTVRCTKEGDITITSMCASIKSE